MEQFQAFGAVDRDPRERIVTVAYVALVPPAETLRPRAGDDAADARWHPLRRLPRLAFDHDRVIALARRHVADRLTRSTIAFRLLPAAFTLVALRRIHEWLLDAPIDERNFREWALQRHPIEPDGDSGPAYRLTHHVDRYPFDPQQAPQPR